MTNPKVSIIMPCYNSGQYIPETIDSVLAQTFQDYEVIIVDDGSNDGTTPAIIAEQVKRDKRIQVITHSENKNLPSARNTGIAAAKGKYILPLDSDDLIHPNYLEKAVALIEKENADVVSCHFQDFGYREKIHLITTDEPLIKKELPFQNKLIVTSLYKKSCWAEFGGYNENMFGYEDWDFWIYFAEYDKKIVVLDEVLFYYRVSNTGLYSQIVDRHKELYKMIMQNHPNFYKWHNYYFTYKYYKLNIRPYFRNFRRFIVHIRFNKRHKKFRLLGIVLYEVKHEHP